MNGALFGAKRTEAAAIIYRVGSPVSVLRAEQTATENRYGKVNDTDRTFSEVGNEHARRLYESSGNEPQQQLVTGGRLSQESPRIAFKHDTIAEEGDRVRFPSGTEYVLDERVPRDTHVEYRSTMIQE